MVSISSRRSVDNEPFTRGDASHSIDADERTSLLSDHRRPPRRDGYLDPDDPAVSPYNLWTVRFLRYLTFLFFFMSFLWWILLFVSIFVSPPYLHTRGSGFFDFAFVTLTLGNLLVCLLFFAGPSEAMRICSGIISVFLLVDMIIIVSVQRIRNEESAVGIASVVWALFIGLWCIVTDRIVARAKREEEERLTGRAETSRSFKEWLAITTATIILIAFIFIVALMTGTLIIRARDASLQMSGQRWHVDGGKYEIHLACVGEIPENGKGKVPTVLLESGENPSEARFEPWLDGALQNGTIKRYCYYDRPGYAWSDNAPSPHSAGMSSTALSEVLSRAGEEGPWILVSAGYGSIVSRIFSSMHRQEVVGLMLVDPLHEDLLHRVGAPGQGFLLWAYGIISPLGLFRIPGAMFFGRTREDRVYGDVSYQSGKLIKARLQENLVADSLTRNEVNSARTIQERSTPLVVISSGVESGRDREWKEKQKASTTITDNLLEWKTVKQAPHEVWRTYEGRQAMERGLKLLVAAAK